MTWSVEPGARPVLALLFELDSLAIRSPGPPRAAAALVATRWAEAVDGALASLGVPRPRRDAGLTTVVAGSMVGIALESLLADDARRPSGAITTLAGLIDAALPRRRP